MSNKSTKKECLKRKLFGLPQNHADFVLKVEAGMVLFLFKNEQRKLYGVFEAISDGALNIVPDAYSSSGKQFAAQVRISTICYCNPLSEHDFRGAIEENYYTDYKFNFGLSRDQVSNLLWLFESRKATIQKSLNQSAESSKVAKRRCCMSLGKGLEKGRSIAGENSREKLQADIVTESIIATGDTKLSQSRFQNSLGSTSRHETMRQYLRSFRSQPSDEPKIIDASSTTDLGKYIPLSLPDNSTEAVDVDGSLIPIIPVRIPSQSNMDDCCMNVGMESQRICSADQQSDSDYNEEVYPSPTVTGVCILIIF